MKLVVLEQDKDRIKFSVEGAGHTFCNHYKSALYGTKGVKLASYAINHPLVGVPTFIVEKTGADKFSKVLVDTTNNIKDSNKAFMAEFKKLK